MVQLSPELDQLKTSKFINRNLIHGKELAGLYILQRIVSKITITQTNVECQFSKHKLVHYQMKQFVGRKTIRISSYYTLLRSMNLYL